MISGVGEEPALRFAIGPGETTPRQLFGHVPPMNVERSSDFAQRHTGPIELDRLVHIERTSITGHVFDLSTSEGYFTAEGIYTGNSDSYAVHGQIRKPEEAFQSWFGFYQHPPNRPNDREVVVPHRMSWPIPPYLAWKTDAQVIARWHYDGRKGHPPPRPKMTTVPLEQFGKQAESPATTGKPPEREIPKERFAFHAPPEVPRITTGIKPELEIPDLTKRRAEIAKLAKKDEDLFGPVWTGPDLDDPKYALEQKARNRLKAPGRKAEQQSYVRMPMQWENAKNDWEIDPGQELFHAGITRGEPFEGIFTWEQKQAKIRAASTEERIAIDDVGMHREAGPMMRYSTERNIRELVDNRGSYLPENEDEGREGAPLLVRIGTRLYPVTNGGLERVAAARILGLNTVNARVIDLNESKAKEIREGNEAAKAKNAQMQARRDAMRDAELKRIQEATDERVRAEAQGDPEVVAAREKHQPADYAKRYEDKYNEAAPSLGWGAAMVERGLDMPLTHLIELAKKYDDPDHPLNYMHDVIAANTSGSGSKTLREFFAREEAKEAEKAHSASTTAQERRTMKVAGTILAHIDAIVPHDNIELGKHPMNVRDARAQTEMQLKHLAGLTDKSVTLPKIDVISEGTRAYCDVGPARAWDPERSATIAMRANQDTETVFHETGHAIDGADRRRGLRASAFLDARTAGEASRPMRELVDGGSGYKAEEIARKDAFRNPYVGKDYGREQAGDFKSARGEYFGKKKAVEGAEGSERPHVSTEVTSMAVQSLGGFWHDVLDDDKDPEHFLFGLGQLGGY